MSIFHLQEGYEWLCDYCTKTRAYFPGRWGVARRAAIESGWTERRPKFHGVLLHHCPSCGPKAVGKKPC